MSNPTPPTLDPGQVALAMIHATLQRLMKPSELIVALGKVQGCELAAAALEKHFRATVPLLANAETALYRSLLALTDAMMEAGGGNTPPPKKGGGG